MHLRVRGILELLRNPRSGVSRASCSALAMAPFMPSAPGVRTSFAPSIASNVRRSSDIVSGIVRISLYPFAAATNASAIPVLPLVGSMIVVSPASAPLAFPRPRSSTSQSGPSRCPAD
jgi:hypothetical protein